jgi:formate hydrogenlyase subunit 6/NADH:ubiquinone oxidoreductase subunit I
MAKTDANPPMPEWSTEYQLVEVDVDYLSKAVKPKQFIHIDQSECIMCEGCVDICPWKCIHMVNPSAIAEATNTELPGDDPSDHVVFLIDDDVWTAAQRASSSWAKSVPPLLAETPTTERTTTDMPTA